jgi:hypothetical protein
MSEKLNLIDITQNYQEIQKEFKEKENMIINQFKKVFKTEIVELMKKLPSVKVLTWTQTTKWEGGMTFDFRVNDAVFLSFVPEEIHKYSDNYELPTEKDFIIDSINDLPKSPLSETEKEVCQQILNIFKNNEKPLEHLFGENIAGYVTVNGIEIYDYNDY